MRLLIPLIICIFMYSCSSSRKAVAAQENTPPATTESAPANAPGTLSSKPTGYNPNATEIVRKRKATDTSSGTGRMLQFDSK